MKISFVSERIENLCRQSKLATKALGAEAAKKLQRRLSELFAATVVSDLTSGRAHPLQYDRLGEFALDLHKGKRLIFRPTRQPPPQKKDGSIDWSQISEITITSAEDYHG